VCRNRTIAAGKGVVRAYKVEDGVLPVLLRTPAPARPRRGEDAAWPPAGRAYGGEVEGPWKQAFALALLALKLLVPVLLLLTLLLAVYLYADAMVAALRLPGLSVSFTIADLVLPGCWTIIHLTNRRYGPAYAFAQLAAAFVLAALIALINPGDIDNWLPALPSLSLRAVLAFFAAFGIANFVAIAAFDAARGPRWWSAPLAASATAAFVFSGVYYPLAFGGAAMDALAHLLFWLAEGVALLLPYCLLRPAMRPLHGMNGF
jgi:uncharacterized PurR-regulated membrane protein YhhQ (DUF165 family)